MKWFRILIIRLFKIKTFEANPFPKIKIIENPNLSPNEMIVIKDNAMKSYYYNLRAHDEEI